MRTSRQHEHRLAHLHEISRLFTEQIENLKGELRTKLAKNIVEHRYGIGKNGQLSDLRDNYRQKSKDISMEIDEDSQINNIKRKVDMVQLIRKYNIYYLPKNV